MKVKLLKKLRKETVRTYHIDYIKGNFRIWFRNSNNDVYTLCSRSTFKEALEDYKHLWHRIAYDYIQEKEHECNFKYPW